MVSQELEAGRTIWSYRGLILDKAVYFWAILCLQKIYELRCYYLEELPEFVVLRPNKALRDSLEFPWNLEARIKGRLGPFLSAEALLAATNAGHDLGMTTEELKAYLREKDPRSRKRWFLYRLDEPCFSGIIWRDHRTLNQMVFMKPQYHSSDGRLLWLPEERSKLARAAEILNSVWRMLRSEGASAVSAHRRLLEAVSSLDAPESGSAMRSATHSHQVIRIHCSPSPPLS
jgi:hypothetical protein